MRTILVMTFCLFSATLRKYAPLLSSRKSRFSPLFPPFARIIRDSHYLQLTWFSSYSTVGLGVVLQV